MPVAKGAAYLLASVHQKKNAAKLKAAESVEKGEDASLLEVEDKLAAAKERRARRRKARGCRHCRRNHDVRMNPINCKPNTHLVCIGCGKILVNTYRYSVDGSARLTIRSCCSEFYGKLSKVRINIENKFSKRASEHNLQ